jgi:hypothetical protein
MGDSGFLFLIFVMGRISFMSLEVVVLVFVVIGIRLISMGNIYVLNK